MPGTIYTIQLKVAGQEQVKTAEVDLSKLDRAARQLAEGIAGGAGAKGLGSLFSSNPDLLKMAQVIKAPPPIPGTSQPGSSTAKGIDWKQAALGLGAAPFSPWVGARALSGSGIFGSGGGGGGLLGRLMGAGGLGGFMEAYIAIQVVMHGLRMAFEEMTEAVKRGSQLYLKAAELGTSAFVTSRLQKTAQLIGMSESALTNLVSSGQFMRGNKITSQDMQNILFGSGRGIGSKENQQAILNLNKETLDAFNRIKNDAQQAAIASGVLFNTNMNFEEMKSAWQTFWQELTAVMSPFLDLMSHAVTGPLRLFNEQLQDILDTMQSLHLITKGRDESFGRKFAGPAVSRPESAWEKMGLIISGGIGGSDYARQTAMNTKRIADYLDNVKQSLPSLGDSTQQVSLA